MSHATMRRPRWTGGLCRSRSCKGANVELNLHPIMTKRLTHTGSTLRPRSVEQKAAIADALLQNIWPRLADGTWRPTIDAVFPLGEAAAAHRRIESSGHIGKIVLEV